MLSKPDLVFTKQKHPVDTCSQFPRVVNKFFKTRMILQASELTTHPLLPSGLFLSVSLLLSLGSQTREFGRQGEVLDTPAQQSSHAGIWVLILSSWVEVGLLLCFFPQIGSGRESFKMFLLHFGWLTSKKIPKLKVCSFTIKLGYHSTYVTGLEKMEASARWTPRMVGIYYHSLDLVREMQKMVRLKWLTGKIK